jgi:multiple sugar transport system permease protein
VRTSSLARPYLVGLVFLIVAPFVAAIALSFTEYSGIEAPSFIGLDNFNRLVADDNFRRALLNSAIYVVFAVPLRLAAAVGAALLLVGRGRGRGAARAAVYLPTVVPDVAYALLWLWLFNPLYGPLPAALDAIGVPSPAWLTDPAGARAAVVTMGVFQIGEGFVVALAARRAIPSIYYDAAAVEGASSLYVLRRVTLPTMAPVIALLALRDVVFSFQTTFVPALILTDGGPNQATTFLPLFVYRSAFSYFRLGYASTITLAMFAITAVVIFVQYRLARRYRLI